MFRCIAGKSDLNLTTVDEIMFFYIQHPNQMNSLQPNATAVLPNTRYKQGILQPQDKDKFQHERGRASHVPGGDESPDSKTGACSIFTEAPPGKVLSVLFLNQTCSRGNEVRVLDIQDGWSTSLDGCSPWKSPGYDVTTANRSALIVIELHNLTEFFKLEVQIKTVTMPITAGAITRYVSPVLGYIQTPGWHPFTKPFAGSIRGIVAVMVPAGHVTLIRLVYDYIYGTCSAFLQWVSNNKDEALKELWVRCGPDKLDKLLVSNLSEFRMKFTKKMVVYFFHGFRLLFSFHQPSAAPQRQHGDLWNCSVPFWPDFRHHFVCNNKTKCAGREDEMWCPDTSCEHGGMQMNEKCYFFLHLPKGENTWHHGNIACKRRNAALASFPTVNSWYHLALLRETRGDRYNIHIGLQSPDARYPHMYRYSFEWHEGSIGHYVFLRALESPPACVSVQFSDLLTRPCIFRLRGLKETSYALCEISSSSAVSSPQEESNKNKTSHKSTKQMQLTFRNTSQKLLPFASISCPDHHWTQDFLVCDVLSACWHDNDIRPYDATVITDNITNPICVDVGVPSFRALFPCQSGANSVPYSLVCNHLQDCADNSDEDFCVFPSCSGTKQYKCANGQCLQFHHHCDDLVQCVDESDETDCVSSDFKKLSIIRPRPPALVDFDGRGWMEYTPLSTEKWEIGATACPDTHVFCPGDGYCLPVYVRCNGLVDCPGHEDEVDCDRYKCPGLYRCRGLLSICLHPDHLCDGWPQCPQHDDELFCNLTCPVDCTCLGHAFTCTRDFHVELFSRLRYLDASGVGLEPGRFVNNLLLVYLSLANSDLAHLDNLTLPNLLSLDLSDNLFSALFVSELNLMKNLQNLSLARNPLSHLFFGNYTSSFLRHKAILHIDLTGVKLKVLDMPSYRPFPKLLSLNLSGSGVTRLVGAGFRSLASLRDLDLRSCPMTVFPRNVFKNLKNLRLVFADNYKLCCEASLPVGFNVDNCQAPFNEVSSCDALLRTDVYRVCLSVLAALSLCGNLGCFSLRIFSLTGRGKSGFNVFVTHLCVSDFVMGVYMAMIGIADRLYLERYLWEEIRWRHSTACRVAGVLALLSSEVSAFIICLITVDRFLVIRFPFSRLRFSSFSAQVASLMTWGVGVMLVIVPLLPFTGYTHFYGQTGICVPLPVTRNDFTGHHYAFGVMILLNLVIFLVIATGQMSVYLSMTSHAMSSIDTTRKSRDLIVARRLITVVVSDFLCWFPLGLLGVLAAQGVPVPGEVNVTMAIFVLPLNSALNPFLYTLNIIQEKRRRATEVKLLKMITDRGIDETKISTMSEAVR